MESILKPMKSHPDDYLRGHTGSHFEQRIESKPRSRRYTKILREDFAGEAGHRAWRKIKQKVLEKTTDAPVANTAKENEITFSLGKDVISAEDAKALHDHLNWVQNKTGEYNKTRMVAQPYRFAAYVQKAFEQKKTINKNAVTNFFSNEDKSRLERNVIAGVARLSR